jgi:hypothetical protein
VWKDKQGPKATYRNLVQVFARAKHARCADALCELLKKRPASPIEYVHSNLPSNLWYNMLVFSVLIVLISVFISFIVY